MPPESATLELFVIGGSASSIRVRRVATRWRESSLTWRRRPSAFRAGAAYARRLRQGTWVSIDVSSLVRRPGVYSFEVSTRARRAVSFASREADSRHGATRVFARNTTHGPKLRWHTGTAPANTTPPSVTGTSEAGSTLAASPGTWSGSTPMSYAYQWQRCAPDSCSDVPGAKASMYPLSADDVGLGLRVLVTAQNPVGSANADSAATPEVLPAPTAPPTVTITSAPPASTTGASATLAWTTTGRVNSTDCRLDGSVFQPCSSPVSYPSMAVGLHSFTVRVTNAIGSTTDTASWSVTAPSAEPACTLYATPTGGPSASGASPTSPTSLQGAHDKSVPGSVVCLASGTYSRTSNFYVTRSGEEGQPIIYRSYNGPAVLQWTGAAGSYGVVMLAGYAHHVEFHGLTIDGANRASIGVKCNPYAHHLVIRTSIVKNTGAAGVLTKRCDYVTVAGNMIHRTGYDPNTGWSSAISLNTDVWSDNSAGFHSFVVGNSISGADDESSYHTEGHGIIMDLGADAPPVLIANNVVFENGGQCVSVYHRQHIWLVNNTCYQNALDKRLPGTVEIGATGSDTSDVHFLNNVAYAWTGRAVYRLHDGASAAFLRNLEYGGTKSIVPSSVLSDSAQLSRVDPLFMAPPYVDPNLDQQQTAALEPWKLGSALIPTLTSPLIDAGIDPSTAHGVTPDIRAGIEEYLREDVTGAPRPRGGGWDIGAYEQ